MKLNLTRCRDYLNNFHFQKLFVEELGWSNPGAHSETSFTIKDKSFTKLPLAELSGVIALEIKSEEGAIPDAAMRLAIHKSIAKHYHENLLIFVDDDCTQSLWYWVKRQDRKLRPRSHIYVKGQPGDLFFSKLSAMVFDISDFDETGDVPLMQVTERLKQALDVEQVTKKFYSEFQDQHLEFVKLIKGIKDDRDRRWYASVLLHRLMFIYFLQRKFFLNKGDDRYLQNKLSAMQAKGKNLYYERFLKILFFEGFAKPEKERTDAVNTLLGKISYLNGGLFLKHRIELDWPDIAVPDKAFENLFKLFEGYSWNLNDTPGGEDNEINPDVLGYIFEKYINQKAFGAYYTRPEITEYLCERTIHQLILDGVNGKATGSGRHFDNIGDLLISLDAPLCKLLLDDVLPNLRLLDPACGSAAFLVAAMKTLINIYSAVIGKVEFLGHKGLAKWLEGIHKDHPSINYFIKKRIITDNLFGVDIMEEAVEIAKLRLFLALVAAANKVEELEPLPNIEFNIMAGNSLIGLLHVDPSKFNAISGGGAEQKRMTMVREAAPDELGFAVESKVGKTRKETEREYLAKVQGRKFAELLAEKNELIAVYRRATAYAHDLQALRDGIEAKKKAAQGILDKLLLDQFKSLDIKYEEATWDDKKNKQGRSKKRALNETDIRALKPFHWGYEFDQIINERGGFDAIITNPPWEVFQTNEKEFFQQFESTIAKKSLRIEDWVKQRTDLMKDSDIRKAWFQYASMYPHQWNWFKNADNYENQVVVVNNRAIGNKPNTYGLFIEQCHNLLRDHGYCGIVIPSGIYTDLGTKQLREMLFGQTQITGLFCFENRKTIFEGVDSRFKFIVLTYEKGGKTTTFPAAFMRHEVSELRTFPKEGAIDISVDLVKRLSPDSLSVPEFKTRLDISIAKKFLGHPNLNDKLNGWGLELYGEELNMTRSASFFKTHATSNPVYEGGMIWHYDSLYRKPRYWIVEDELRVIFQQKRIKRACLSIIPDAMKNDYEAYRLAIRKIASNTNERTLVVSIIPPGSLAGNSLSVHFPFQNSDKNYNTLQYSQAELIILCAMLDSFVLDYILRARMTTNLSLFYIYQLPVPRLTEKDPAFRPIVDRAARLICTTPEFDDLAKEVMGGPASSQTIGVTESVERAKLRAELDGLIAHLYGLTEDEFAHILTTFPIVPDPVKVAAHNAFRNVEKGLIR